MKFLGTVSSEGGPILLADASVAQAWNGVHGDGSDYERVCVLLDQTPDGARILIGSGEGLLWDAGGPGTVDIVRKSSSELVLFRSWSDIPLEAMQAAAIDGSRLPVASDATRLGRLRVDSALAILWSVESGRGVDSSGREEVSIPRKLSVGGSGLVVTLNPGVYAITCDGLVLPEGWARRCIIAADSSG
jgi:hypothetical protein